MNTRRERSGVASKSQESPASEAERHFCGVHKVAALDQLGLLGSGSLKSSCGDPMNVSSASAVLWLLALHNLLRHTSQQGYAGVRLLAGPQTVNDL